MSSKFWKVALNSLHLVLWFLLCFFCFSFFKSTFRSVPFPAKISQWEHVEVSRELSCVKTTLQKLSFFSFFFFFFFFFF